MAAPSNFSDVRCDDFLEFEDMLKKMRVLDDKIVYALNTSIPTDSFKRQIDATSKCKELHEQLTKNYDCREKAIKKCITETMERVKLLKDGRASKPDDLNLLKNLRKEQTKLRMLQSEVNIEEVVKERSLKLYYERCRSFYKPKDFQL